MKKHREIENQLMALAKPELVVAIQMDIETLRQCWNERQATCAKALPMPTEIMGLHVIVNSFLDGFEIVKAKQCECGRQPKLSKRSVGRRLRAYLFQMRCRCGRHTEERTLAGETVAAWDRAELFGRPKTIEVARLIEVAREGFASARTAFENDSRIGVVRLATAAKYGPAPPGGGNTLAEAWYRGIWFFVAVNSVSETTKEKP